MNTPLSNLVIYNGYPLSVAVALIIHIIIFITLLYLQSGSEAQSFELIKPTVIKALFIDENPQLRNRQLREQRRVEQQQRQKLQRDEEQRLEMEESQQREAEQQRLEREKAALREREELERLRALAEREERERGEAELERRRQQEIAAEQELKRQQELERRRQEELAEASAAEAARTEYELVQSATTLIQRAIQEMWSRPPSARNGMRAVLQIRMLPTGEVLDAVITQSSGDPAFDRSAENALYRAAPFRELQSLPINVFNTNFRSLSLIFEPEDLLN